MSPILKNGDNDNIKNYRTISVFPSFFKILEKILHNCFLRHLSINDLHLKKLERFPEKSFYWACHNSITLIIQFNSFNEQLETGPSSQIGIYFRGYQGSKLLNDCLVVWPNKQMLRIFLWQLIVATSYFILFILTLHLEQSFRDFYRICIQTDFFFRPLPLSWENN